MFFGSPQGLEITLKVIKEDFLLCERMGVSPITKSIRSIASMELAEFYSAQCENAENVRKQISCNARARKLYCPLS